MRNILLRRPQLLHCIVSEWLSTPRNGEKLALLLMSRTAAWLSKLFPNIGSHLMILWRIASPGLAGAHSCWYAKSKALLTCAKACVLSADLTKCRQKETRVNETAALLDIPDCPLQGHQTRTLGSLQCQTVVMMMVKIAAEKAGRGIFWMQ